MRRRCFIDHVMIMNICVCVTYDDVLGFEVSQQGGWRGPRAPYTSCMYACMYVFICRFDICLLSTPSKAHLCWAAHNQACCACMMMRRRRRSGTDEDRSSIDRYHWTHELTILLLNTKAAPTPVASPANMTSTNAKGALSMVWSSSPSVPILRR